MKKMHTLVLTIEADTREGCIALAGAFAEISKAGDPKYKTLVVKGRCKPVYGVKAVNTLPEDGIIG